MLEVVIHNFNNNELLMTATHLVSLEPDADTRIPPAPFNKEVARYGQGLVR